LVFSLVALASWAQTNAVHNWTLKSGAVFSGDYYTSGTLVMVIKSHGTNCPLRISELSTNDWLYYQDCKAAQRQRLLDAEAAQFRQAGLIELSRDLIKNYPESVNRKQGWMDAEFYELGGDAQGFNQLVTEVLGFEVTEKGGSIYDRCVAPKGMSTQIDNQVMQLKPGDKVRFIGEVIIPPSALSSGWFMVDRIEMIESAADAAAIKKVKQENSQ